MSPLPLLPTIGVPELLIILVIVLIFFGVGKLPQIGKALGEGIKGFKEGAKGDDAPSRREIDTSPEYDADQAVKSEKETERSERRD